MIAGLEPSCRSAYSTETNNYSLVIGESELANSMQNGLGLVSGQDAMPRVGKVKN